MSIFLPSMQSSSIGMIDFTFSNAMCFNIIFTGLVAKFPSFCDYLRNHNEILELLYPRFSSFSICEVLIFLMTVEDGISFVIQFFWFLENGSWIQDLDDFVAHLLLSLDDAMSSENVIFFFTQMCHIYSTYVMTISNRNADFSKTI